MSTLAGYKTYIVAGLLGLATVAQALGWITPEQFAKVEAALLALGMAALRAGISKAEK